jgi:hypothetical protein
MLGVWLGEICARFQALKNNANQKSNSRQIPSYGYPKTKKHHTKKKQKIQTKCLG